MKVIYTVLIALSLVIFQYCTSNSNKTEKETLQEKESVELVYTSGVVKEVQRGKDGYTARIVAEDSTEYFATISIANLRDNASQFREAKVGETVMVKGDNWKIGEENHITVRELK
jgi:hypothetical protein